MKDEARSVVSLQPVLELIVTDSWLADHLHSVAPFRCLVDVSQQRVILSPKGRVKPKHSVYETIDLTFVTPPDLIQRIPYFPSSSCI
jgi:hypothetical protein